MEVPRLATPLTQSETAQIFLPAFQSVFGRDPSFEEGSLLLALLWNENARGRSIIQYNWGNLSSSGHADATFWRPPWYFEPGTLHDRMLAGGAPSAFRAFPSHEAGAHAWLDLLNEPRYSNVIEAAQSGDSEKFAQAVAQKYCADPECKLLGPTYEQLASEAAPYLLNLQKKKLPAEVLPECS